MPWEIGGKILDERSQGGFLSWGVGVTGMVLGIQSSLIANPDGVLVMVLSVGTDLGFRATLVNSAITFRVVVVADVFPAMVMFMSN